MANFILNFILLEGQTTGGQQGGGWSFWVMMLLIFVVFYFFMIRPQTKRQKELQKKRDAMKKGDKIITAGGIYGEIKDILDDSFIISVSKDTTLRVDKSSVQPIEEPVKEEKKEEKKEDKADKYNK